MNRHDHNPQRHTEMVCTVVVRGHLVYELVHRMYTRRSYIIYGLILAKTEVEFIACNPPISKVLTYISDFTPSKFKHMFYQAMLILEFNHFQRQLTKNVFLIVHFSTDKNIFTYILLIKLLFS